jgi:hypothetical protein
MALPVTISGISTTVSTVGPFKAVGIETISPMGAGGPFIHSSNWFAQSFTTGTDQNLIYGVYLYMEKLGSPAGSFTCNFHIADGSGRPNGAAIRTYTITAANVPVGPSWVFFPTYYSGTSVLAISPGASYVVSFSSPSSVDNSNCYSVHFRNDNPYAGGLGSFSTDSGSSWGDYFSGIADFVMKVSSDDPAKVPNQYYFFGVDGTTGSTLQAYKATDPTSSWSSITTKTSFGNLIGNIAGCQTGSIIHLLVGHTPGASLSQQYYVQFDMALETFGTTETVAASGNSTGQTGALQYGGSIAVRDDGQVVAFFNGVQTNTMGTAYARVYYALRNPSTGVWDAAVRVDDNTAIDNTNPEATLSATFIYSSNRVHFFWLAGTSSLTSRTLSAADGLNTGGTISGSATAQYIATISYNDSGAVQYRIIVACSASPNVLTNSYADTADDPTWATSVSHSGNVCLPLSLFNDETTAYMIFRDNDDGDLYFKSSTDHGASWTAQSSIFTGTVAAAKTNLSRDGNIYQRSNLMVIPYIVNDSGTLRYNEYTVRTLGTPYARGFTRSRMMWARRYRA